SCREEQYTRISSPLAILSNLSRDWIDVRMGYNSWLCVFVILGGKVIGNRELELWNAARDGDLVQVRNELAQGISPLWRNPDIQGETAIHIASKNNHPDIVSTLLDSGVDINIQDDASTTPLREASWFDSTAVANILIDRGANVDIPDKLGHTPLMAATFKSKSLSIIEALIKAGADMTLSDNTGNTALHLAALLNKTTIAKLLLQNGANARAVDNKGNTPASIAREKGYPQLAAIIDSFTVNITDTTGEDIGNRELKLWNAARDGDLVQVNNMLAKGTSPLWRNPESQGETAIHIASKNNYQEIVIALLDTGVDINIQDDARTTPLREASWFDSVDVATMLIELGANVDIPDKFGHTPLMAATFKSKSLSIIKALINARANVKITDNFGNTALHLAALLNKTAIAQLLLLNGADARALDNKGKTPGYIAREKGHPQLADIIDSYTGDVTATTMHDTSAQPTAVNSTPKHPILKQPSQLVQKISTIPS
ncbi:unnamed protein product, partial [Meganyctiphanes norvegica]